MFICSGVLTLLLAAIYLFNPAAEYLSLKSIDIITNSAKLSPEHQGTELVVIDDKSLEKYGQWPWPRYRLAWLVNKLKEAGAEVIAIDIFFPEKDRTSPLSWKQTLFDDFGIAIDTSTIPAKILDHDQYLAENFNNASVILGYEFLFDRTTTNTNHCKLQPVSFSEKDIKQSPYKSYFHQADDVICNYGSLADAASGVGFFNGSADRDGILRRIPLLISYKQQLFPSFFLATFLRRQSTNDAQLHRDSLQTLSLAVHGATIPVDSEGNFLLGAINYSNADHISAADLFARPVEKFDFHNKTVFLGLSALGLTQEYPTSSGSTLPLVALHRHAYEALGSDYHTTRTDLFPVIETILSLLLSVVILLLIFFTRTHWNILFFLIISASIWFGTILVYQRSGLLFSPLLPLTSVTANYALLLILKYWQSKHLAEKNTKKAIQLLESSEKNLQAILNAIPDIIFRLDDHGRITFISPAISKYTNSQYSLIGQSIFELVDPADTVKAHHRLNERRTGERATHNMEIRLKLTIYGGHTPETSRYFSVSAEGLYIKNEPTTQKFLGTQGIVRDITERKKLENQLLQAQKMEVVGNLAAGVAHDLNNILSGLVSYPDILLLEIPEESPMHKKVQIIQKSGKHAAVIVQDLLTLARRSVIISEVCNINDIISEYTSSIEYQQVKLRHPLITMHSQLDPELLHIKGSPAHLSKALMNIIQNGFEAMPTGGELTITTSNIYLDIDYEGYELVPKGEYVSIEISDSGIGISQECLQRIFEPFYTKKSMSHSGTGLGMTVIWATTKDHNGFIDIRSNEGLGTIFTLYFPTTRETTSLSKPRIVLDDYLGNETVLIVDDVLEQLDIARGMLEKLGYSVLTAANGSLALNIVRDSPVDLVVLDMIMPGNLDGLETYLEILKIAPGQRAIIASGFSQSERVKKLQQLGAGQYIQKPYTLETLGVAVRSELDRVFAK